MLTKRFPESIAQRGGLRLAAVSPDGELVLTRAAQEKTSFGLLARGEKRPREVRLHTQSDLFPTDAATFERQDITGVALASHEGRTIIVACWRDDHRDGPGIGAFDLEGQPIFVDHILPQGERTARVTSTSISGASTSPQGLLVSPDGTRVAMKSYDNSTGGMISIFMIASIVAGKPEPTKISARELDLAFDSNGTHVGFLTFSSDDTTLHTGDVKTGATSALRIAPEGILPRALFGCGVWTIGNGAMFTDDGAPAGKFPGDIRGAARVGESIAALAATGSEIFIANATTREMQSSIAVPKLNRTLASGGNVLVVGTDRAARIFTL